MFMSVSPQGSTSGVPASAPITFRFGGPMASGMEQYFDMHLGGLDGPGGAHELRLDGRQGGAHLQSNGASHAAHDLQHPHGRGSQGRTGLSGRLRHSRPDDGRKVGPGRDDVRPSRRRHGLGNDGRRLAPRERQLRHGVQFHDGVAPNAFVASLEPAQLSLFRNKRGANSLRYGDRVRLRAARLVPGGAYTCTSLNLPESARR